MKMFHGTRKLSECLRESGETFSVVRAFRLPSCHMAKKTAFSLFRSVDVSTSMPLRTHVERSAINFYDTERKSGKYFSKKEENPMSKFEIVWKS